MTIFSDILLYLKLTGLEKLFSFYPLIDFQINIKIKNRTLEFLIKW